MIDTAVVEETLGKDPQARLEVAIVSDRRASMLRAASLEHQLWKLEFLDVVPMRAPLPARGRVDMLV